MLFERAHFVATTPKPVSKKAAALGLKNSVAELSGKNDTEIKMEGGKLNQNELKYFENSMDLMQINGKATKINKDECEDGTEMPDLNMKIDQIKL